MSIDGQLFWNIFPRCCKPAAVLYENKLDTHIHIKGNSEKQAARINFSNKYSIKNLLSC